MKLPLWVKVVLTGRPQIEAEFEAWTPVWITPDDEHNRADMLELLRWRLEANAFVATADLDAAARLMLDRSKVRQS